MKLRIATCRPLPEPDPDEDLLLDALAAAGVQARMAAWNDPAEAWTDPIPTVIRSTWDYIHDADGFLEWVRRVNRTAPLWNGPRAVAANVHKRYLVELEARGIPVIPTALVTRDDTDDVAGIRTARGWGDIVIKPAVGAASHGTRCFVADERDEAERHLAALIRRGDALIQPYVGSVDGHGERALVWIDGAFTHAVRKSPRFSDGEEDVSDAVPIAPDELVLGQHVLATIADDLLYARVDVARDDMGRPLVMEVELIEPSLFLLQSPPALERLVQGMVRRLT